MATPYSLIHQRALSKFADYDILRVPVQDRERVLNQYLYSSIGEFAPVCRSDLSDRDEMLFQFNQDLTEAEVEILAIGEAYFWIQPHVLSSENLHNMFSVKDANFFSPANLLKEMQALRDALWKEFRRRIVDYTYRNGDIVSAGG